MSELERLSKIMAARGMCSRREADFYIERGWVRVDGEVATLGQKILPTQAIELDRQAQQKQAARVTFLLNKPVGFVSGQAEDGHAPAASLITPENHWAEDTSPLRFSRAQLSGLAPAGRLDIESVGLLVLTQDGRIARRIIAEDSDIDKEYLVRVAGHLSDADLKRLNHGLSLDGEKLLPARVWWQNQDQLRFVLREGKKRQIRRMCDLVGLQVLGLKRIRIGRIMLGHLPTGKWRYLSEKEKF